MDHEGSAETIGFTVKYVTVHCKKKKEGLQQTIIFLIN